MQEAGAKWGAEGAEGEGEEEDDDELPFACHICRRPWDEVPDPVVTRCKHYFCEHLCIAAQFAEQRQVRTSASSPPMASSMWPRTSSSGQRPRRLLQSWDECWAGSWDPWSQTL